MWKRLLFQGSLIYKDEMIAKSSVGYPQTKRKLREMRIHIYR